MGHGRRAVKAKLHLVARYLQSVHTCEALTCRVNDSRQCCSRSSKEGACQRPVSHGNRRDIRRRRSGRAEDVPIMQKLDVDARRPAAVAWQNTLPHVSGCSFRSRFFNLVSSFPRASARDTSSNGDNRR